jgi:hypothetical protein
MFGLDAAQTLEQLSELGRGRELVRQARERSLRFRARGRAVGWHLRLLVPAEKE